MKMMITRAFHRKLQKQQLLPTDALSAYHETMYDKTHYRDLAQMQHRVFPEH